MTGSIVMRSMLALIAACVFGGASCRSAMAISTQRDTINDVPMILRTPSTFPPNSGLHRYVGSPDQSHGNSNEPGAPALDEGPSSDADAVTVSASSAPWAVALSGGGGDLKEDYVCAGALIAPNWVLTAAHCLFNIERRWPSDVDAYVFTKTSDLNSPQHRFLVHQIVMHPKYDPRTLQNDLALIKIDVSDDSAGAPIKLEGPPIAQQVGEIGSILGWGITTKTYGQRHKEKLQVIQNAIVDDGVCFSAPHFQTLRNAGVFCAKSLYKYHGVCFRFGGSPLVMYDTKANLYLAGLVSWSTACPSGHADANAYLDVQFHVPWIKSVISDGTK